MQKLLETRIKIEIGKEKKPLIVTNSNQLTENHFLIVTLQWNCPASPSIHRLRRDQFLKEL